MTSTVSSKTTTTVGRKTHRSTPGSPARAYSVSLRYTLIRQAISMAIFYVIYLAFAWGMPLLMFAIVPGAAGQVHTGQSPLFIPTMIYIVITNAIAVNSDFKLFVQFGFSRKRIFALEALRACITSVILALLTVLFEWLVPLVYVNGIHEQLQLVGIAPYANGTMNHMGQQYSDKYLMVFVLCFVAYLLGSALGTAVGILLDRLGTMGKLIFVALLFAIPTGFMSFLTYGLDATNSKRFSDFLQHQVLGIQPPQFRASALIVSMLVVTAILFAVIYLLNRRREVKRVNA